MTSLLLVHGAGHGAWCWRDTLAALDALGHRARAIDLPGLGDDPTPPGDVTFEGSVARILDTIDEPVTLVGHSMAGFAITAAALAAPARIRRLIFVCAYVPRAGRSLSQMRDDWPERPLLPAIRVAEDGLTFTFDPARLGELFYHDCPAGTVALAQERLRPQPMVMSRTALDPATPSQPRHYILCAHDAAIPPGYQARMCADWPADRVTRLATGHSPFFAAPGSLATELGRIAASD